MSNAPCDKSTQPEQPDPGYRGRTGKGVASVLPYLHKQVQVKIPVPIDDLPALENAGAAKSPVQGADGHATSPSANHPSQRPPKP